MVPQAEILAVAHMVLARLLPAGDKGATLTQIKKDLEPWLPNRGTNAEQAARLDRTLDNLVATALIQRTRKGKTDRSVATAEGRRQILDALGIEALPPRMTWAQLKKSYLPALALGLPSPRGESAKRLGTELGFRAALLKIEFALPVEDYPTFPRAFDAYCWQLLGLDSDKKFTIKAVQAALIQRAVGDSRDTDAKKALNRLLARRIGARREGELRDASIRRWVDRVAAETPSATVPDRPPAAPPQPPLVAEPALNLTEFAQRVLEAARATPGGRFGDDKVFVAHVWRALRHDPAFAPMSPEDFKRRLAEANNARLINLSRADLVEAMDPADVAESAVPYLGMIFHFVHLGRSHHESSPRPA